MCLRMRSDRMTAQSLVAQQNRRRFCLRLAGLAAAVFLNRQVFGRWNKGPRLIVSGRLRVDCWEPGIRSKRIVIDEVWLALGTFFSGQLSATSVRRGGDTTSTTARPRLGGQDGNPGLPAGTVTPDSRRKSRSVGAAVSITWLSHLAVESSPVPFPSKKPCLEVQQSLASPRNEQVLGTRLISLGTVEIVRRSLGNLPHAK
jgi:hypothetical protein